MACTTRNNIFFFISCLFLSSQYDWTKFTEASVIPVHENEETALLHYLAYELPLQLDKSELVEEPFVRIEKAPEPIVRVREGSSVTLECEAIGIPPPIIYWRKQGKRIKQTERDDETNAFEKLTNLGSRTVESSTTGGRLRLDCVEPSMAGLYECVAENGYGRAVNRTRIAVLPRDDQSDAVVSDQCTQIRSVETQGAVPPSIVMYTQFRFENEGNNVQLFCRASGFPTPQITWLDSEEQPLQMDENLYILPNGDLFIRNVQAYAQYFCVASNIAGEDKVDSFVYATA